MDAHCTTLSINGVISHLTVFNQQWAEKDCPIKVENGFLKKKETFSFP